MDEQPEITLPGGNIFGDLGLSNPETKKLKLRLAITINKDLKERDLTQAQAAHLLREQQPRLSALANYKLSGFSLDKLVELVTILGHDIDLTIGRPKGNHRGRIQVREPETAV